MTKKLRILGAGLAFAAGSIATIFGLGQLAKGILVGSDWNDYN